MKYIFLIFHIFLCLISIITAHWAIKNEATRMIENKSEKKTWNIKKNIFIRFSHFILLGILLWKIRWMSHKSVQVVKKWLSMQFQFFSMSSRLVHKPNYSLWLVSVTFLNLRGYYLILTHYTTAIARICIW